MHLAELFARAGCYSLAAHGGGGGGGVGGRGVAGEP